MKQFDIPEFYRSPIITQIKRSRSASDRRKQDLSPTVLDFGPVQFLIARHFGFCFGVENAIEISYKALHENPGKRIFLLSQMIHNPVVNDDLYERGIRFIMDTEGNQFIPWDELKPDDVVIVPAFGTTLEIEKLLTDKGISIEKYNTTCPFVEKVWKRSSKIGGDGFTIIIHGKHQHEETRATYSHAAKESQSLVLRDITEAEMIASFIRGSISKGAILDHFKGRMSEGFDPDKDLQKVGVVNQTTMLATETQQIADIVKAAIVDKYGIQNYKAHFADTRDTLCYATNDNQSATYELLKHDAEFAIVVGGYNSSNTSHIVELCEEKLPTYFINAESEILSDEVIRHFNYSEHTLKKTVGWLPEQKPLKIILTSGASCPDSVVERVMLRILSFYDDVLPLEEIVSEFTLDS